MVLAAMAAFVVVTYVVIVLGGGALIGQTDHPNIALSILATAVVALGFEPMQALVETAVVRRMHGDRPSAYQVLSRFSDEVSGPFVNEELPERIARVLRAATGASWAQVWLIVNARPVLASACPSGKVSDPTPPGEHEPTGRRWLDVTYAGERLAILRLQEPEGQSLTAVEERLFSSLAAQAGLVLRGAALRAELADRLAELSARAQELTQSRERLIDTQDTERRRLERDIHDGAQQHLVALAVNLRLAQTLAAKSPDRADQVVADQRDATQLAISTLTDLSRGIYPRTLGEQGVAAALSAATARSPVPVQLSDAGIGRLSLEVETAVYFCALEAIQNAVKHADASRIGVALSRRDATLVVEVTDDGAGFDPAREASGEGLANMRDRVDAVGGRLTIRRADAGGTLVRAEVPTSPVASEVG
jgi:signal transduction histidine kinase